MDLRQLRTFVAVAETGSLTRAVHRVHVVQPAMSRQIRLLEEEVGGELFTRAGRGMQLTRTGEMLLERARHILAAVDQARQELTERRVTLSGSLTCGVVASMGDRALVPFFKAFSDANPQMSLRIVSGQSRTLLEQVTQGRLDVAVFWDEHSLPEKDVVPLVEDPFFVVAPAGAGLSVSTPVGLASLQDRVMLLPGLPNGVRQLVESAALAQGVKLTVRLEIDAPRTRLELVCLGLGWTILPGSMFSNEFSAGRVCCAPLTEPRIRQRLVVATPFGQTATQAARRFKIDLTDHIQSRLDDGSWPSVQTVSPRLAE